MNEKFLCVMAGYDEPTEAHLSSLQNELYKAGFIGTHTKNLPQHITLATYPLERESEILALVKDVAAKTERFDITINHIGLFGGSKVCFIVPDPNTKLLDLKECFGDSHNWTPHTTMLIDEPARIFEAIPVLAEHFTAFQGKVEYIHLYEFWPAKRLLTLEFSNYVV